MKLPNLKKIQSFILNLPIIVNIVDWSKNNSLPGFFKVPIYDVIVFIRNEIKRDALVSRANSVAFSLFLSIFPGIIFIFTLIPYILPYFDFLIIPYIQEDLLVRNPLTGEVDFNSTIISQISYLLSEVRILPANARDSMTEMISSLATKTHGGRLYFVLLLTIFFSSNGMMTLFRGFEKSHQHTFKKRSVLRKRMVAISLTLIIVVLMLVSLFLIVLGQTPLNYILDVLDVYSFSNRYGTNLKMDSCIGLILHWYFDHLPIRRLNYYSIQMVFTWGDFGNHTDHFIIYCLFYLC